MRRNPLVVCLIKKKRCTTMEQIQLEAVIRKKEDVGKKFANRLRKDGFIPAVVYKANQETLSIAVNAKEFAEVLHTSAGGNVIIELKIYDDDVIPTFSDKVPVPKDQKAGAKPKSKTVIIKQIQYHHYKDNILHVDF